MMEPSADRSRLHGVKTSTFMALASASLVVASCSPDGSDDVAATADGGAVGESDVALGFTCPEPRTTTINIDREQAPPGVTLDDVLSEHGAARVQERSASRAVAVVAVDADATGVLDIVRDPNGSWAVNSLTTCLP